MPKPRRSDTTVQPSLGRAELRATRPHAILGMVPKSVAMQAPRWLTTRSNLMLEGKAVQASSIEHLGEASPRRRFRPRRPLPMVPRMRTPPLNSLPAIRVDARKAMCSLTPDTAWGSPTSHAGVVVPLETDDQLRRSAPAVVAPGTLVRLGWRRGKPAATPTRMLTVPTLATWRQHHDGVESGHRSWRVERRWC
jgi:hypothetical protein